MSLTVELGCRVVTTKVRSLPMQGWREASSGDFPDILCVWLTRKRDMSWKLGKILPVYRDLPGMVMAHPQNQRPNPEHPIQKKKLEVNWMWNPNKTKNRYHQRKGVRRLNETVEHRSLSKSLGDTRFEEKVSTQRRYKEKVKQDVRAPERMKLWGESI